MAPLPFFSNAISVFLLDLEQPEPKLLLMRRKYPPVGAWCQVAGKIKADETAWQAALREVKEEVGLDLNELWTADICEMFYVPHKNRIEVLPVFVALVSSETQLTFNDEHDAHQWFTFEDARAVISFPEQRRVLDTLKQEFVDRAPSPHLRVDLTELEAEA